MGSYDPFSYQLANQSLGSEFYYLTRIAGLVWLAEDSRLFRWEAKPEFNGFMLLLNAKMHTRL